MIPQKIHYCWFGGKPLPELAVKCISSWKKYCQGYEIIEWNESNFDINCCDYVQEAYEAKKWAFVSDYVRFKILYEHGGIYLDTDVELIKPIDDIVNQGPFMGLEPCNEVDVDYGLGFAVNPGLGFASNPGHELIAEILKSYHSSHFVIDESGSFPTVVTRITNIIKKHGSIQPHMISHIAGISIYPPEYFCPLNYYSGILNITDNTVSIHHYSATWHSLIEEIIAKLERCKKGNNTLEFKMRRCVSFPFRIINRLQKLGIKDTIKLIQIKLKKRFILAHK